MYKHKFDFYRNKKKKTSKINSNKKINHPSKSISINLIAD